MNPSLHAALGYANPYDDSQAPDFHALGFATQPDPNYSSDEKKVGVPLMPKLFTHKIARGVYPPAPNIPLPTFELGEVPTYDRQQGSEERGRGKISVARNYDSRMVSGDLVNAFITVSEAHKYVPAPLSEAYQGSPWNFGALYGLPPQNITNGSAFVAAYSETLREESIQKKAEELIRAGYEEKRVLRVMEEHLDDLVRQKLRGKK